MELANCKLHYCQFNFVWAARRFPSRFTQLLYYFSAAHFVTRSSCCTLAKQQNVPCSALCGILFSAVWGHVVAVVAIVGPCFWEKAAGGETFDCRK